MAMPRRVSTSQSLACLSIVCNVSPWRQGPVFSDQYSVNVIKLVEGLSERMTLSASLNPNLNDYRLSLIHKKTYVLEKEVRFHSKIVYLQLIVSILLLSPIRFS